MVEEFDPKPTFRSLAEWLVSILPDTVSIPWLDAAVSHVDMASLQQHFGLVMPQSGHVEVRSTRHAILTTLSEIQDFVIEDVLWGLPWPAAESSSTLPMPDVEQIDGGLIAGFRVGAEWILRSPPISLS